MSRWVNFRIAFRKCMKHGHMYFLSMTQWEKEDRVCFFEKKSTDGGACPKKTPVYESMVKPALDKILSFLGLIILSPVYLIICFAIIIDDPGPVFFIQKRVGKNKHYIFIHKFRTMKTSAPHDIPTHMFENPEQYITSVGRVLRKTSLDELPQIWDIFRGRMSIIGPRPALWNQDDLMKERERYGANGVMPGLTGIAQIKGRDELPISEKAKLDGEYVKRLKKGGVAAFFFDVKIFFGTIASVLKKDGVVEGGTGKLDKNQNQSVNEIYKNSTPPVKNREDRVAAGSFVKILIVGADSYIGTSVGLWLKSHSSNVKYLVDTFDTLKAPPTIMAFTGYDVVFHVAGIAHRKESRKNAHLYYEVNRDLAIKAAKIAKKAGIRHFMILSSMAVYGLEAGVITRDTKTDPKSNYAKSKLAADEAIWNLRDENFRVAILRPPIVYGKGCKGNYQRLRKFALWTSVFPDIENQRSMLFVGNLCSFVQKVIEECLEGIFFPQNAEYVSTSQMVKAIADIHNKNIATIRLFNPILTHLPIKIFTKVFGTLIYEQTETVDTFEFYKSLDIAEGRKQNISKKSVIIVLTSYTPSLFWYRIDMMQEFIRKGYKVYAAGDQPEDEWGEKFKAFGINYKQIFIQRNGINPFHDMKTIREIINLYSQLKPEKVFTYQAKSTIYGGIAARIVGLKEVFPMIGGVGSIFLSDTIKSKLLRMVIVSEYKIALKNVPAVFFQNTDDEKTFRRNGIITDQNIVRIHGSGVNIKRFSVMPLPSKVAFLLTARLIKDKGIYEYLDACMKLKSIYRDIRCLLVGPFDTNPTAIQKKEVQPYIEKGMIEYFGNQDDVRPYLEQCSVFVLPSYREGTPKAVLEAMACGRAILTTDTTGCRETVKDGKNGYLVPVKDSYALFEKMKYLVENPEIIFKMAIESRHMAEEIFDVDLVNKTICQTMGI